jgi:hypothetical protein
MISDFHECECDLNTDFSSVNLPFYFIHSFIHFIHPGDQNTLIQELSIQLIHYRN